MDQSSLKSFKDDNDWISYYATKKDIVEHNLTRVSNNTTVDHITDKVHSVSNIVIDKSTLKDIPCTSVTKSTLKDIPCTSVTSETMRDTELVSPVQSAVQQARAAYKRATPKKKHTTKRRTAVRIRGGKVVKRRIKRKKPVKRLKKHLKKAKSKKKKKTKSRKRDIFNQ